MAPALYLKVIGPARGVAREVLTVFPIQTRVAGVTFENADGTPRQPFVRRVRSGDPLTLSREPENPFDPNAIAVSWADETGTWRRLGYVPRALASVLAPLVDDGLGLVGRAVRASKVPRRGLWTPTVWGVRIAIEGDAEAIGPAQRSGLEPAIAQAIALDEATPDPGYAPVLGGHRGAEFRSSDGWSA
ncbi:MAG: HIRAN domain-containing protein [Candidatus Sericytochromatia bacterium]|nr:HIRAN domain-containing protein [Candidatus Sericytochromatia bacterium]